MARYPRAKYRPVVGLANDPPITPIGVILHVSSGTGRSLFNWFNGPSKGVESHFYLNKKLEWEQYRDTNREADANYKGNSWIGKDGRRLGFISIETEGGAKGEWSPAMVAELKAILLWLHQTHKIPLQVCETYRSPGVGYHVMFGTGHDNSWSNARGKVCPGPDRILQFKRIIVPWMLDVMTPGKPPVPNRPPAPKPKPVNKPTLSVGNRGDNVEFVQRFLGLKPVDGIFGPKTRAAVANYQSMRGLHPVDGIVGPTTWRSMLYGK